jgi:hypothetical protein
VRQRQQAAHRINYIHRRIQAPCLQEEKTKKIGGEEVGHATRLTTCTTARAGRKSIQTVYQTEIFCSRILFERFLSVLPFSLGKSHGTLFCFLRRRSRLYLVTSSAAHRQFSPTAVCATA